MVCTTVCHRFAFFTGVWGRFGPKQAVLGQKMRSLGRAPPDLAPPPRGATGEFLAQNLDLARAHQLGPSDEAEHAMAKTERRSACLLACCLLACWLLAS